VTRRLALVLTLASVAVAASPRGKNPVCIALTFGPWDPTVAPFGLPVQLYSRGLYLQLTDRPQPRTSYRQVVVAPEAAGDTVWPVRGLDGKAYYVYASQLSFGWESLSDDSLRISKIGLELVGRWRADTLHARAHAFADTWNPGARQWRASAFAVRYECGSAVAANAARASAAGLASRDTVNMELNRRESAAYDSVVQRMLDDLQHHKDTSRSRVPNPTI
jgi:hypothetical protein